MNTDPTVIIVASLVWLVLILGLYVWTSLALAAVFRKSGQESWQAWVPILNQIVLLKLAGLSPWLVLLNLLPVAGWVVLVYACHIVGRSFGYGAGMTVLAALVFPVWASVVGFGSARWVGLEQGPRRTGRFDAIDETSGPAMRAARDVAEAGPRPPATSVPAGTAYSPVLPPPAYGGLRPAASGVDAPVGGWTPPPLPTDAVGSPVPPAPEGPVTSVPGVSAPAPAVSAPAPASATPVSAAPFSAAPAVGALRDTTDDVDPALPIDTDAEVTGAEIGAPAPISAVPSAARPAEGPAPTAPLMRTPAPGVAPAADDALDAGPVGARRQDPWAPATTPEADAFGDSAEVSAVAEVPGAGGPLSARSSVSAQNTRPEIPDDPLDETIVARRKRTEWAILTGGGEPIPLGSEVVLLGRRPSADPAFPTAQLVSIHDGTVSKTHARLELRGDVWFITDLDSTNGVVFATVLGTEVEAMPGEATEAGDRFLLGDAEIRLVRTDQ